MDPFVWEIREFYNSGYKANRMKAYAGSVVQRQLKRQEVVGEINIKTGLWIQKMVQQKSDEHEDPVGL